MEERLSYGLQDLARVSKYVLIQGKWMAGATKKPESHGFYASPYSDSPPVPGPALGGRESDISAAVFNYFQSNQFGGL